MMKQRLPIKVVVPGQEDWDVPKSGGSSTKVHKEVDDDLRKGLARQVQAVAEYFRPAFVKFPKLPAVARIRLHHEALAKTHRPQSLLGRAKCPMIGGRGLGELLIGVDPDSLERLQELILTLDTKSGIANISTLEEINPYTADEALSEKLARRKVARKSMTDGKWNLKLRLFQHDNPDTNRYLEEQFRSHLEALGIEDAERLTCYGESPIFQVQGRGDSNLIKAAGFIGTRAVGEFPRYRVIRTSARRLGPATAASFPPPLESETYPVLGLIDSGVDPSSQLLAPWVDDRHLAVAANDCDYNHGTFVGALAVNPLRLNNGNSLFRGFPCKLLDCVLMPASGEIPENELLQGIEDALSKHPDVKIWNLSVNSNEPCSHEGFSDLAMALDELQDEYGVTFVVAAGNYQVPPLRGWPADDVGNDDLIGSPADSVRGLTVGSLAHLESATSRVRIGDPSPFSRRGPGPAFLPKPEVTHVGGNCDKEGNCVQVGVISLDGSDSLVEDIGTSFSTPLVSSILAGVHFQAAEPMSPSLAKALVIHSASLGREKQELKNRSYFGFGVPGNVNEVLSCDSASATLIFEPELIGSKFFEKRPFPFPECLRNPDGSAFGVVHVTVVYDPPLDPDWGLEYCQANVEVSLGSYDHDKNGKRVHKRLIPPEQLDLRQLFESEQIKSGFKWSPVKNYRRELKRVQAQDWRLKVAAQYRADFQGERVIRPVVIITVADPEERRPVYDQMVRLAEQYGWQISDLRLRQDIRVQVSG
jgi:serine protease AprX